MILVGSTGGRWMASSMPIARPSPATRRHRHGDRHDGSVEQDPAVLGHATPAACWSAGAESGPVIGGCIGILACVAAGSRSRVGRTRRAPDRCRSSSRTRCTAARRGAVLLAERAHHHQVVPEHRLRPELVELAAWCPGPARGPRSRTTRCVRRSAAAASGVKMCSSPRPRGHAARAAARTCATTRRTRSAGPCDRSRAIAAPMARPSAQEVLDVRRSGRPRSRSTSCRGPRRGNFHRFSVA